MAGTSSSTGLFEVRAQEYLETLPSGEHSGVNRFLKGLGKAQGPRPHPQLFPLEPGPPRRRAPQPRPNSAFESSVRI